MCVLIENPEFYVQFLQHRNNPDANQILKRNQLAPPSSVSGHIRK